MMLDAPVQVREALRRRMKLHLDNGESGNALDGVQNPNLPLTLTACAMNPGIPQPLDHLYNGSSDQLEEDNSTSHSDLSREQNDPEDNEDLTPEVQNAFRIFQSFKAESHKSTMAPFWHPIGPGSQICFRRMDDKFTNREYESITAFVTDFRLMLENCYRFHGVDHWISKLAQKLEIILEQKLTLLSRPLRMKTRLSVTSSGSCASEEEHPAHSSTNKRRSSSRTLNALHSHTRIGESMMVQALRLEELQRHRKERRQRDLSRKEVEEASVKELEDWDTSLLSLAEPWPVSTLWELPAIGHFLCLAQEALRLPEIVFCELERCLLMPRCSSFLARVMTALLCPDNRRGSGHRRATMPYRKWEAELRLRVHSWYTSVSTAENQTARAEKLGLCPQFFWTLGDTSPLERTPFHQLPFNQRVWLLKGLCDHVYHTQRLVQEGVLQQPIHECRESILGYDTQENVYVHFPHFCGADLRIYCQSPCGAPCIPLQEVHLKREPESEVTPLQNSERNLKELEPSKVPQIPEVQKRTKIEDLTLQGTLNTFGHFRASQNPLQVDEETTRTVEFEEKEQFQMSKIRSKGPKVEIPKGIEVQHQRSEVKMERSVEDLEGSNVRSGADLQESKVKEEMDLIALDLNEDRGGNLHQKCPSESPSPCRSNSPSSRNTQERDLKGKGLKTEEEVYLRVGNTCYQGFSPALNSVRHPTEDRNHRNPPQKKCSGLKESFCSQCKVSRDTTQKKKERLFEVLKANTKRRRLRLKRRQCKRSLQRLAKCIKRREGRRKLGKQVDGQVKFTSRESPSAPRPEEPTFQLVCSSLDDLRVLISKTGDQFSRLNASRKRAGQRPLKRAAVKELNTTLVRLLNELLPWEPKLIKAFQRNRARLKKEFDDFKKHPEYENFTRQKVESVETGEVTSKDGLRPTEAAGELEDGEDKQRGDSERAENINQLANFVSRSKGERCEMLSSESGPFTRSSKRRQIEAMTDDLIPFKNAKMEHNSFLVSECNGEPLSEEQASISQLAVGSIKGSCNPIQALLAKSVGNKVTLISHAKAAMMAHELASENVQPRSLEPSQTQELTATFTTEITEHVMDTTASGGPLNKGSTREKVSVQPSDLKAVEKTMKHIVILPSNLMIKGTDNKTARLSEAAPLSLVSGITFSESKIPVQQVGPLIDASAVTTTATVATPSLMSVGLPKHTTEPKVPGTDGQKRPDDKEELKTVCIRDSQSILVTTRGGNTGVVKLQNKTAALPPNTGFKISPQLQTLLLSKSSTSSTTQAVAANLAAKSLPGVTPQSVWKDRLLLNSSTFVTTSDTPFTLNKTSTASFGKVSNSVLVPLRDVEGIQQNAVSKCGIQPIQKTTPSVGKTTEQSRVQKVFLVSPSSNFTTKTTTAATCSKPASKFMFIGNSGLPLPRCLSSSDLKISSSTTPALKVTAKLGTSFSLASSSASIVSIGVPGSTSKLLNISKISPEATSTSVIVSTASVLSATPTGSNNSLISSSSGTVMGSESVGGKRRTYSTLGSGHMASSALVSVVKPSVPSISTLKTLHFKPDSSKASSTSCMSGKPFSNCTSLPVDVTTTKAVVTSVCSSLSMSKRTDGACTSSIALSGSSVVTPPGAMTSGIHPLTSVTKNVNERVVINTTAPLAPGTQVLINNSRFVVPSQGLGPGNHVLLIHNPVSSGSSPIGPIRLQVPSPIGTTGFQVPTPLGPAGLQIQSPILSAGMKKQCPVNPAGLLVPSPIQSSGLKVTSLVRSPGLQVPSPVQPSGLQVPNFVRLPGLHVQSPIQSSGLKVPSLVRPHGLQAPSPVYPSVLQVPNPSGPAPAQGSALHGQNHTCPKGLQKPSPASSGRLIGPCPLKDMSRPVSLQEEAFQASRLVNPDKLQFLTHVQFEGFQALNQIRPLGLEDSDPTCRKLQVSTPIQPGEMQGPKPVHASGLQERTPRPGQDVLHTGALQVPLPMTLRGLKVFNQLGSGNGSDAPSPTSTVPKDPKNLTPLSVPTVVQGVKLVKAVNLRSPIHSPSGEVQHEMFTRTALNVSQSTHPPASSDIVRITNISSSQGTIIPKDALFAHEGILGTTSPIILEGGAGDQSPHFKPPMGTVVEQNSTDAILSKMQKLLVATVQTVEGPNSTSSATPIVTVPPPKYTVIMSACPPIRVIRPEKMGKTVFPPPLPQSQCTVPSQTPTPGAKLVLSSDGAVLNISQPPKSQEITTPVDPQGVGCSSSKTNAEPIIDSDDQ